MSEQHPTYFTGLRLNRLTTDFMVRSVGDLVEIGGTQFTAQDALALVVEVCRRLGVKPPVEAGG